MMKLTAFDISASGLTAQRFRMDVTAANIANAQTTRARLVNGEWEPYRRKLVVMEPKNGQSFADYLQNQLHSSAASKEPPGVVVTGVIEDTSPFRRVYNPEHPDADADGYVSLPNVDILKEMVDLLSASRSYEANVTALNASKSMFMKALDIGR